PRTATHGHSASPACEGCRSLLIRVRPRVARSSRRPDTRSRFAAGAWASLSAGRPHTVRHLHGLSARPMGPHAHATTRGHARYRAETPHTGADRMGLPSRCARSLSARRLALSKGCAFSVSRRLDHECRTTTHVVARATGCGAGTRDG